MSFQGLLPLTLRREIERRIVVFRNRQREQRRKQRHRFLQGQSILAAAPVRVCSNFSSGVSSAWNCKSRWNKSVRGNSAVFSKYGELRHSQRVWGSLATWSFSIWTNRTFPMPASPVSKTTCPCPAFDLLPAFQQERDFRLSTDQRCQSSGLTATSRRLLAPLSWRTRYTWRGSATPRRVCSPNASQSKYPWTKRYVASLIAIVLGAASP